MSFSLSKFLTFSWCSSCASSTHVEEVPASALHTLRQEILHCWICPVIEAELSVDSVSARSRSYYTYLDKSSLLFLVAEVSKLVILLAFEKTGAPLFFHFWKRYYPLLLVSNLGLYMPGPGISWDTLRLLWSNLLPLREITVPVGLLNLDRKTKPFLLS